MTISQSANLREYSVLGFKKEEDSSAATVDTETAYRDFNLLVRQSLMPSTRAQAQSALANEYLAEW